MKPIQDAAPAVALTARYGLMGKLPLQLDEVVVPVVIVDELTLNRERPASGRYGQAAAAGNNSHVQLLNPAGSGVLVLLERLFVYMSANDICSVGYYDTALTTLGATTAWRDRRLGGQPVAQVRAQNNVAILPASNFFRLAVLANLSMEAVQVLTLLPGQGVCIYSQPQNVTVEASWYWREMNLLPAEG